MNLKRFSINRLVRPITGGSLIFEYFDSNIEFKLEKNVPSDQAVNSFTVRQIRIANSMEIDECERLISKF